METTFLQTLKKKAGKLIEPSILKSGHVLEVRNWEQGLFIEIDLHLPEADMSSWREVHYIKFHVEDFTYRDYSPTGWDAETHTCTLLVDASHNGPGIRWAKRLKRNDQVQYLKIDTTHQLPDPTSLIVGLGDASSVGHFLGLQQLVLPTNRFIGAVSVCAMVDQSIFSRDFRTPIVILKNDDKYGVRILCEWIKSEKICDEHTRFYLAGHDQLVSGLRRELKQLGILTSNISVKGFWS